MDNSYTYVGEELILFSEAKNWKSYFSCKLFPFLRGDVLEVGAGIGGTVSVLHRPKYTSWTCLEPDREMSAILIDNFIKHGITDNAFIITGSIEDLAEGDQYDTILYIDVLEHIKDDSEELRLAQAHLRPYGRLIILAPAYNWLFSRYDGSIGHYRRYSKKSLKKVMPEGFEMEDIFYLDFFGILLSIANRIMLKQKLPTRRQINIWDTRVVPFSRFLDRIIGYRIGKTVIGIWKKTVAPGLFPA